VPSPLEGITFPFPVAYANKLKQNCAQGDPICSFSGANYTAHLTYGSSSNYIEDSANFIFNEYQTKGGSGPSQAAFGRPGADPATSPTAANIASIIALAQLLGGPTTQTCPV
jgi:Cutinase